MLEPPIPALARPRVIARAASALRNVNAMTPETDKTTHYFWAIAQDRAPHDEDATATVFHEIQKTMQEDVEVFDAQQRSLDLKPNAPMVNIKSDAGPIAARRIVDRLLRKVEQDRLTLRKQA